MHLQVAFQLLCEFAARHEGLHVALDAVKGSLEGVRTAAETSAKKPTAALRLLVRSRELPSIDPS
jgi:hypothetical protein